jgi:N-acetylglucosaminyldiphosphoundecaprenol N-acetyl-beta-D-mannosaminyltransferase
MDPPALCGHSIRQRRLSDEDRGQDGDRDPWNGAEVLVTLPASVVEILGIPVYDGSLREAIDTMIATCTGTAPRTNRLVSATGAHGLVHAQKDRSFAAALHEFDMNLPDGLPGVWVGKHLKGAARMERIRGPDFFRELMSASAGTAVTHFLCGGKDGVAETLRTACRERFANASVVGTYCPPFRQLTDADWSELATRISASKPDIVWIGLSTPKQEMFACELAKWTDVHYIVTVGAAFDFHIGAVREAPVWVQRSGFEWFYRMCLDPKRLVRRYAEVVPLFLLYNLRELVGAERKL